MRILHAIFFVAIALTATGCATGGGETLKVKTKHVLGVQSMPNEVNALLQDLGYQWIPVLDRDTGQEVKTVIQGGDYRMAFVYAETGQVRIDTRIREADGHTRLHFYEPDGNGLSPSSMALLERLKQRLVLEFGQASVSY